MKYYLIAGERSGDFHAADLMRELRGQDAAAEFRFWGGDLMQAVGGELVHHYQDLSIMGFVEAATSVLKFRGYLKECERDLLSYKPDVLILVDYAGFNMRVAKFAKAQGIKVFYYISPKIWAWNTSRVEQVKARVDKMFVILPFEEEFYQKFDYQVEYIGNPTADAVAEFKPTTDFFERNQLDPVKPIIAVLPGSRKQELEEMLHEMLAVLPPFMDYQFVVAGVTNLERAYYQHFERNGIKFVFDQTFDLLSHAKVALVTSGTATLETALFGVPQIVCYRTSLLSYAIGKMVIKVPYISLVNLIAGREVVKELIQNDFTARNLVDELKKLLKDEEYIAHVKAEAITELGVGEALVSFLEAKGTPSVVERALIAPPQGRVGPITPAERAELMAKSPVRGKYDQSVDNESAYEMLAARKGLDGGAGGAEPAEGGLGGMLGGWLGGVLGSKPAGKSGRRPAPGLAEQVLGNAARSMARKVGTEVGNAILRNVLGGLTKR